MEPFTESYHTRGQNGYRAMSTDSFSSKSSQRRDDEKLEWSPYGSSRSQTPYRPSRSGTPLKRSRSRSPFRRSKSRTPFRRTESRSPIRSRSRSPFGRSWSRSIRIGRSCSPYKRGHTFSEDYNRPQSSSIWECAVCLEVFNDRKDLLKHLSDSGHSWNFRGDTSRISIPPQRSERHSYINPPFLQHSQQYLLPTPNFRAREQSFRKQKGRFECFICYEPFSTHGQLEKHISLSGHRWSYRKAQQLKKDARGSNMKHKHDYYRTDDQESNSNLWQSRDASVEVSFINNTQSEWAGAISSPERTHQSKYHPEESTSAMKSPASTEGPSKVDTISIPLEVTKEGTKNRDPRPRDASNTLLRTVSAKTSPSKSHKWSPILQRGFEEGIPWKLIPVVLMPNSGVEERVLNAQSDGDPVANALNIAAVVDRSNPCSPHNSNPTLSNTLYERSLPWSDASQNTALVSDSRQSKELVPCRYPPRNQLDSETTVSTSTRFDPPLPQMPLNPVTLKSIATTDPVHVPSPSCLSKPSLEPSGGVEPSPTKNVHVMTSDRGKDVSSRSPSPFSELETVTVLKAVDCCQRCSNPFCISRFSINVATGDVTTICVQCGTCTIMQGVFRLG